MEGHGDRAGGGHGGHGGRAGGGHGVHGGTGGHIIISVICSSSPISFKYGGARGWPCTNS